MALCSKPHHKIQRFRIRREAWLIMKSAHITITAPTRTSHMGEEEMAAYVKVRSKLLGYDTSIY